MERATLTKVKNGATEGPSLSVSFNPKELTFSRSITWNPNKSPKADQPDVEFGGGGSASLKLQLVFDTYLAPNDGKPVEGKAPEPEDVRKKYPQSAVPVDPGRQGFEGDELEEGAASRGALSLGRDHLRRRHPEHQPAPDAVPAHRTARPCGRRPDDDRVSGRQTLREAEPDVGGRRRRAGLDCAREGDTLPWIAYNEYKDATEWRPIADANGLTQVRRLVPGTALVIPSV